MNAPRRRTLGLLLAGLLLAVLTPVYLAIALGLEGYLLHPAIFAAQAVPYLLAGALWLPCRTPPATSIGQGLSGLLLVSAGLLYIPMLTGLLSMGGDMVGLAFISISVVTVAAVLAVTVIAHSVLYIRRRRAGDQGAIPKQSQQGSAE